MRRKPVLCPETIRIDPTTSRWGFAMTIDKSTLRHPLFWVGLTALGFGVWMTFEFGRAMSNAHAGAMALLTILVALMWSDIDKLWRGKRRILAGFLTVLGVLFVGVEFFSHIGYTVGHRIRDAEETGVQNARFQMAGDEVVDNRKNLDLWRKNLAELQAQQPWVATVTADGLRAELANLTGDFVFKRSKQCTDVTLPDSRKHCDQIADVKTRIGLAEQKARLTERIEATQRLLSGARQEAKTTEFRTSPIVAQVKFASQIATGELEPGQAALTWTQILIAFGIALVTTFVPPVALFLARNGRGDGAAEPKAVQASAPDAMRHLKIVDDVHAASPPLAITRVLTDARMASAAAAALAQFRPKALEQQAA